MGKFFNYRRKGTVLGGFFRKRAKNAQNRKKTPEIDVTRRELSKTVEFFCLSCQLFAKKWNKVKLLTIFWTILAIFGVKKNPNWSVKKKFSHIFLNQ